MGTIFAELIGYSVSKSFCRYTTDEDNYCVHRKMQCPENCPDQIFYGNLLEEDCLELEILKQTKNPKYQKARLP